MSKDDTALMVARYYGFTNILVFEMSLLPLFAPDEETKVEIQDAVMMQMRRHGELAMAFSDNCY